MCWRYSPWKASGLPWTHLHYRPSVWCWPYTDWQLLHYPHSAWSPKPSPQARNLFLPGMPPAVMRPRQAARLVSDTWAAADATWSDASKRPATARATGLDILPPNRNAA